MTRYLIAPDAEDGETLWDNDNPDVPEPIVSTYGVTPDVWSVLEMLPDYSPERIRAAVELAEACVALHAVREAFLAVKVYTNEASRTAKAVIVATTRRSAALSRYREARDEGGPEVRETDPNLCVCRAEYRSVECMLRAHLRGPQLASEVRDV